MHQQYEENYIIKQFRRFIVNKNFPCLGAKSTMATNGTYFVILDDLRRSVQYDKLLPAFKAMDIVNENKTFTSIVTLFPNTPYLSELEFENCLWSRLQELHHSDCKQYTWDNQVSSDVQSSKFAMSYGGRGYFIIGLHPGASRCARRAPTAAIVFNPHSQFEALKLQGKYNKLRNVIRERDVALQGYPNPMLKEHGQESEAPQYSGRMVTSKWICPFSLTKENSLAS